MLLSILRARGTTWVAWCLLCLIAAWAGAIAAAPGDTLPPMPPRDPGSMPLRDDSSGGRWIGEYNRLDAPQPLQARVVEKSAYVPDSRIATMAARASDRLQQRWRQVQAGERSAASIGESSLRFEHHADDRGVQRVERLNDEGQSRATAQPKAAASHTVRLVRQSNQQPVGEFYLFNDTARQFVYVPASGVVTISGEPGETVWLHVAPPSPVATRRVALDLVAGQTDYTLPLVDGAVTEIDFAPEEGALSQAFWVYFTVDGQYNFVRRVESGHDRLGIAFDAAAEVVVRPDVSIPYFLDTDRQYVGTRRGNVALPMERGALVSLAIEQAARITLRRERSNAGFGSVQADATGAEVLLPRGEPMRIDVLPEAPWLPTTLRGLRFDDDGSLDVALERGVALTLDLRDEQDQPTAMEIAVSGPGDFHTVAHGVSTGHRVAVPNGIPVSVEAKSGEQLAIVQGRFDADTALVLRTQAQVALTGTVRATVGDTVEPGVRVEAWRGDERVGSDLSDDAGVYRLKLPPADYALRYFHEGRGAPVAPVATTSVTLAAATPFTLDLQITRPPADNTRLLLPAQPCTTVDFASVTFEADGVRPALRRLSRSSRVSVAPGAYRVTVEAAGFPKQVIDSLVVPASGTASIDLQAALDGQCRRWTGTLRDAAGEPLASEYIAIRTGSQDFAGWVWVGADGAFSIPLNDGWTAEFQAPAAGNSLRQLRPLQRDPADRVEDVRLLTAPALAAVQPIEGTPQLLLGDAVDPSRLDIVFVAEAYVGTQESFDDVNGNGVWDGRLFADIDGDGLWVTGEPYTLYGDAPWPGDAESGTDISAANEPFDDRNGDGYPSIDDPSVFGRNIADFVRELVSLPFWAERSDRINVWALWFDSEQAGMDLIATDGEPLSTRTTAFDGRWLQERSLLAVDYARVEQVIAAYKPNPALRVVMMNQPVQMGRANSYILYYGGVAGGAANSTVASHELGHAVGLLADEYQEFRGNYVGMQSSRPNLTKFADPDYGKWTSMVSDTPALHDGESGIGWLDGGGYQYGGLYRPATHSTMRYNSPLFNAPSRIALLKETCHRFASCSDGEAMHSGVWWNAAESGWGLFTFDQGSVLAAAWFTYDDDGEPVWFLLPSRAGTDGIYRGDIMRLTGTPFDRIDGVANDSAAAIGAGTLQFDGAGNLTFGYRIGAVEQTKQLAAFPFGERLVCRASPSGDLTRAGNVSDLWWNPAESGWGLFIVEVDTMLFAGWYTYDNDGEPLFLTIGATRRDDGSFVGEIHREHGGTPYPQIDGQTASDGNAPNGTAVFRFEDGAHGEFEFTIDGTTRSRPIERLQVGSVASECMSEPD